MTLRDLDKGVCIDVTLSSSGKRQTSHISWVCLAVWRMTTWLCVFGGVFVCVVIEGGS